MLRRFSHGSNVSNVLFPNNNFPNPSELSEHQNHIYTRWGGVLGSSWSERPPMLLSSLLYRCRTGVRICSVITLSSSKLDTALYATTVWCSPPKVMHAFLGICLPNSVLHAFERADHFIQFLPFPKTHRPFLVCSRMPTKAPALPFIFRIGL